jgi:hypothetical protein
MCGIKIGLNNHIKVGGKGFNWRTYWAPTNAVIEDAEPANIVLTYDKKVNPTAIDEDNFTVSGNTCYSATLDGTGKIITLSFQADFIYAQSITIVANSNSIAVINNILPETELTAYNGLLTTPLSTIQKKDVNQIILGIKNILGISNLTDKGYYFYLLANETEEAAWKNLIKNDHHGQNVSSLVFTQFEGITGVGTNYAKTDFVPSVDAPASLNDAHFSLFVYTAGTQGNGSCGVYITANPYLANLIPLYTTGNGLRGYLNDGATSISMSCYTNNGLKSVYRKSNLLCGLLSDMVDGGVSIASTGLPNLEMYLFARNKNGSPELYYDGKLSGAFYFKVLTVQEDASMGGIFNQYLFNKGKHQSGMLLYKWVKLTNDPTKYQAFGNIAKDKAGNLYVVYRTEDDNIHGYSATGKAVMKVSTDQGYTWSAEITVADEALIDDRNVTILITDVDGEETIIVSYMDYDAFGGYNYCVRKALVSNKVFGSKITAGHAGTRSNPIVLSNGKILAPGYTQVLESSDGGDSWIIYPVSDSSIVSATEPSIIECKTNGVYQGKVVIVFRKLLNTYNKIAYSYDYGHTWTNLADLSFGYNTTLDIIRYDDDTLLLFIGTGTGINVYKSTDEGDNWSLYTTFGNATIPGNHHPSIVKLNNNHIGYHWTNNDPGSDVHFMDIIIDPDSI